MMVLSLGLHLLVLPHLGLVLDLHALNFFLG